MSQVNTGQTSGGFDHFVDRNPHSFLSSAERHYNVYYKCIYCFLNSLTEFNNSAVTSHSTVFHCQFQLWFNKGWLKEGGTTGPVGDRTWVRGSRVAKGVIIPQGVAYCCLSLCDKTKQTGLGSIAVFWGFYSAVWQCSDELFKAS